MQTEPFELTIRRSGKEGTEHVLCKATLRVIPGNREVFDGQWHGKEVIVKVFSQGLVGRLRFERERRGLTELEQRGINSPRPLFYGRTQDRQWAIATEKITDAASLRDVYRDTTEKKQRLNLLLKLSVELAKYHEKGVVQTDLHLGNFLLQGDKLFAIDPAQIRFFNGPIGKNKSISQLALLTSNLDGKETEAARSVWREYFNGRRWQLGEPDERALWEQTSAHKRAWIKHALKKCLRTGKRFVRIREDGITAVFDRGFCDGTEPNDFMRRIDEIAAKGEVLKKGRTSCVQRMQWNSKDIVIKRYNHKGLFHSLRHTIKGSRARQGWLYGHLLTWLGITTPKPLAYIESRKGGMVWESYLVTEYVAGRNLHNILNDQTVSEDKRSTIVQEVLEMIENLHKNRITHRDLKLTNILVTADGPVLTDLDAMKVHKLRLVSQWKGRKYIERFRKDASKAANFMLGVKPPG